MVYRSDHDVSQTRPECLGQIWVQFMFFNNWNKVKNTIFFREERQALLELEDRQRENDKFSKWQHDEDQFHLKQAHLRSNIRIVDGRAKPIDLLAKYISAEEGKFCK